MSKQYSNSVIPITQNCVLALSLDYNKKQEHLIIGELSEIQRFLHGDKSANLIFSTKKPLGSFIASCFSPVASDMANLRVALCDGLEKEKSHQFEMGQNILKEMYYSSNYCHRFLAVRLWQEYHKTYTINKRRHKNDDDKVFVDKMIDRIEVLTLPYRFSIEKDISTWQSEHPQHPLRYFDTEYHRYHCGLLFANDKKSSEYAFADVSLMPLIFYTLRNNYKNHLYYQRCKRCNHIYLAHTANIKAFCSAECKREQSRLNKHNFDAKAKQLSYEKSYKAAYMYWYNRVKKLRNDTGIEAKKLSEIEIAFSVFCDEAVKRKARVKDEKAKSSDYEGWLLRQRDVIDGLTEWL